MSKHVLKIHPTKGKVAAVFPFKFIGPFDRKTTYLGGDEKTVMLGAFTYYGQPEKQVLADVDWQNKEIRSRA